MKSISEFENRIGYVFKDKNLIRDAFTHTSYVHESKKDINSYERLEFLGDAILDMTVSEYLFEKYPDFLEGDLSQKRAIVVCERSLAMLANKIGLGDFIRLGHGEELSGGRSRDSILSDVFEAVLAAIFLDAGFEFAQKWVLSVYDTVIDDAVAGQFISDYKTEFQEVVQSRTNEKIEYHLLEETGPDHNKIFKVALYVGEKMLATGSGKSKKIAEQQAAQVALRKYKKKIV